MLRDYTKYLFILYLLPALAFAATQNMFVEGQDYLRVDDALRKNAAVEQLLMADPHKVQVIFFFNYACHGCEMMHTPFEEWAAKQVKNPKSKVAVYTYPVSFNAQWAALARLYYVTEMLDSSGKLNNVIFTLIHKHGIKLWDKDVMRKFFLEHGYTDAQFELAYNSFNVNRQIKRADDLTRGYNVVSTPEIIINGPVHSYKLDFSKAGNNIPRLMEIINYLVTREAKLL